MTDNYASQRSFCVHALLFSHEYHWDILYLSTLDYKLSTKIFAQSKIFHYLCSRKPKVCRHIKKRLLRGPHNFKQWGVLSACFGTLKSCKISPAQSKKAVNARWDMHIPPQSIPCGLLCLVAFHIRRGRCLLILVGRVIPEPRYGE